MNARWPRVLVCTLLLASAGLLSPDNAVGQDAEYRVAAQLHNDGEFKLAAVAWKGFIDKFPTDKRIPAAKFYLGFCYSRTQKYAEAAKLFDDIAKKHAKFEHMELVHLHWGNALLRLGQTSGKAEPLKQAIEKFDLQIKNWPKGKGTYTAHAHYSRADALYALDDKKGAAAAFGTVVSDFKDSSKYPMALYSSGVCQQDLEQWETAGKAYAAFLNDEKLKEHAFHTEVMMRYGETLLERPVPQFTEAEKWLEAAAGTKDFALADYATFRLADSFSRRKKYAEAADKYLSIPERFPKLGNINLDIAVLEGGKCAYLAGKQARAREALGKLVAKGGEIGSEAAHWTARSYLQEKMTSEALKVADAAIPKSKGTIWEPELMMDKADALFEAETKRKDAVSIFAEIAKRFSTHRLADQALYNAAFTAMRVGDHKAALGYCDDFRGNAKFAKSTYVNDVTYVAAECHMEMGQYDKATPLYQGLISANADSPDAEMWKFRLGQSWFLQKKYKETLASLKPYLASFKMPARKAEAYYLYGQSLFELDQPKEGVESLRTAISVAPEEWGRADNALVTIARALRKQGNSKDALAAAQKVLADHPDSDVLVDAHFQVAECSYDLGDYKTAAKEHQWVLTNSKEAQFIPYSLYGLGWTQVQLKDAETAVKTFTLFIGKYPQHMLFPRAHLARGSAYQQLRQCDKAETDFTAFLKSGVPEATEKSDVRYELGRCQMAQKKFTAAVGTFETILKEDANYANAASVLHDLAWSLRDAEKPKEAAARFSELYKKFPATRLGLEGHYQTGEFHYEMKDYAKAETAFADVTSGLSKLVAAGKLKAAETASLRERAIHKHGWSCFHTGSHDKAEASFAAQLKTFANGEFASDGRFMLAKSQFEQKKYSDAYASFDGYRTKHVQGRFVEQAKLHLAQSAMKLGLAAADKRDTKTANQWFQRTIETVDEFLKAHADAELRPEAIFERAWALHNLEKLDEATEGYKAVLATKTKREVAAKAQFMVGEVLFQQKKYDAAVIAFYNCALGYGYPEWQANARYEAARCFEQLKNKPSAIKNYRVIVDKFKNSDKFEAAQKALKRLGQ